MPWQWSKAAAITNTELGRLTTVQRDFIVQAYDEIIAGKLNDQFPWWYGRQALAHSLI